MGTPLRSLPTMSLPDPQSNFVSTFVGRRADRVGSAFCLDHVDPWAGKDVVVERAADYPVPSLSAFEQAAGEKLPNIFSYVAKQGVIATPPEGCDFQINRRDDID